VKAKGWEGTDYLPYLLGFSMHRPHALAPDVLRAFTGLCVWFGDWLVGGLFIQLLLLLL
jgi:hypothetical protein